jgi:MraZ protein
MLRGNYTARIDDKGRLKIPTHFRRKIEEKYGSEVYVTSLTGESVNIFPLSEWEKIEQKLALLPSNEAARRIYLTRMNFYGQESEIDNQGRILIHPLLREKTSALRRCRGHRFADVSGCLEQGKDGAVFTGKSFYRRTRSDAGATGYIEGLFIEKTRGKSRRFT